MSKEKQKFNFEEYELAKLYVETKRLEKETDKQDGRIEKLQDKLDEIKYKLIGITTSFLLLVTLVILKWMNII